MFVLFLTIAFVIFASEGKFLQSYESEHRLGIAGGQPADIRDYPYQVSIILESDLCGGAIISPKLILTAAHCTTNKDLSVITVRAGSNYSHEGGKVSSVLKIYEHPNFDPETYDYDVAVLELDVSLEYGQTIKPIDLASSSYTIESYKLATVTGYGYLSYLGPASKSLRKVDLPLLSTEDCQYVYGDQITERMFCAGFDTGGKDACQGDSGGPIVCDDQLIGIVSFGPDCASAGMPGGYAKVSAFRQFIDQVVNSINSNMN